MKKLIREIVRKVLSEGDQLEWGDIKDLPRDEPVTVGIASSRTHRKTGQKSSPKWRFIKTTAGKAHSVVGQARRSDGFYDSSVSRGH